MMNIDYQQLANSIDKVIAGDSRIKQPDHVLKYATLLNKNIIRSIKAFTEELCYIGGHYQISDELELSDCDDDDEFYQRRFLIDDQLVAMFFNNDNILKLQGFIENNPNALPLGDRYYLSDNGQRIYAMDRI